MVVARHNDHPISANIAIFATTIAMNSDGSLKLRLLATKAKLASPVSGIRTAQSLPIRLIRGATRPTNARSSTG